MSKKLAVFLVLMITALSYILILVIIPAWELATTCPTSIPPPPVELPQELIDAVDPGAPRYPLVRPKASELFAPATNLAKYIPGFLATVLLWGIWRYKKEEVIKHDHE